MPMLQTHPQSITLDRQKLATAIDALTACAEACTACGDACLGEGMVEMTKCVGMNLDCADMCMATARVLSRQTSYDANITRALVEACAMACKACSDECAMYAEKHEYCRICAEACQACERACRDLMASMH
jgi:hypothetical protein